MSQLRVTKTRNLGALELEAALEVVSRSQAEGFFARYEDFFDGCEDLTCFADRLSGFFGGVAHV